MEIISIKPDEFKLYNFINYYIDNIEEIIDGYPKYTSRICLIDRDYMDVITHDDDYEGIDEKEDYMNVLLEEEYSLCFVIAKTNESLSSIEFIDGNTYSLDYIQEDIYEGRNIIKNIGDTKFNLENLTSLLFDIDEEGKLVISMINLEHGGDISQPRITEVDNSGDFEQVVNKLLSKFIK